MDLESRRAAWRDELLYEFALPEPEVKELESHLSESIERAIECGSTPERAFDLALVQLGSSETIAREFRRSNPAAIWAPRVLGMVGGSLLLSTAPLAAEMALSLFQFLYQQLLSFQLLSTGSLWGMRESMSLTNWVPPVLTCVMCGSLLWVVGSGRLAGLGHRGWGWVLRAGWIPAGIALVMTSIMWFQVRASSVSNPAWDGSGVGSMVAYVLVLFAALPVQIILLGLLYARLSRRVLAANGLLIKEPAVSSM